MLDGSTLKNLSSLRPWHSFRDILFSWSLIFISLYLVRGNWWFLPVALPVIASRLHALTVLMHDGSHYLLHPNRTVNEIMSNLFCSFPLMLSTEAYRKTHWPHHQHTQTYQDPNFAIMRNHEVWDYPKPKAEVVRLLWKDMVFMGLKDHMIILKDWQFIPNASKATRIEKILFVPFIASVVALVYFTNSWREFIIFQLGALWVNPLVRIRAMSEHAHYHSEGQSKFHKLDETPTINAGTLERFFISPFNTNRHLEHHLYPTIPYYNLERTHQLISKSEAYQKYCRYELDGYFFGDKTALDQILVGEAYSVKKKVVA